MKAGFSYENYWHEWQSLCQYRATKCLGAAENEVAENVDTCCDRRPSFGDDETSLEVHINRSRNRTACPHLSPYIMLKTSLLSISSSVWPGLSFSLSREISLFTTLLLLIFLHITFFNFCSGRFFFHQHFSYSFAIRTIVRHSQASRTFPNQFSRTDLSCSQSVSRSGIFST